MNTNIFRQYDIRGVADRDLNDEIIDLIGRAFASYLKKVARIAEPSLVLGRDIRPSSDRIYRALSKALIASGIPVTDVGILTTPVCYFAVQHLKKTGGIMITGSHNPPEYNGLKLVAGKSSIYGEEIQKIRAIIERKDFVSGKGSEERVEIIPTYQDYLKQSFKFKRKLKVVVDSGNGTAGLVAPKVIREFGHDVIELFSEPDSRFPNHHPDPTVEKNLEDLIKKVKETKADVGIAFDGDADRVGIIDDKGTIIWGDKLLILFSRFILKQKPGAKFVADVKCSYLFFDDVKQHGGQAIMWKTGHSLIKQKLRDENAALAGEMSGHMFFADRYFGYDDGVYAGIRVLEILDQSGKRISELLSDVPKTYATPEIRVDCPDEEKFQIVARVAEFFKSRYRTIDIDGVRIEFGDGWGLVRSSNTQPVLVTRFEATSEKRLHEIKKLIEDKINEFTKQTR
ncbi:MAG: phosphomannomutase [Omnitrophica bacterium RIFCSPHIGHO2_02_FULL_46_11]|nr:MAG: phosphomannomutase [Omnitrophica bacterium RIFCSPHIGHO2_02_FULL_46_11]OGW87267.1 MAG: phosphomannomutase [Omnitrophica bacterium RIFCSPLOWO2_01_FULL_45_10b]